MEHGRWLESADHEDSALLHSRQGIVNSDELDSAESPVLIVDEDLSFGPDAWKEFERRRSSAEYYMNQYLESLDRISQTCVDFDTPSVQGPVSSRLPSPSRENC